MRTKMSLLEWIEEAEFCERRSTSGEYGLFNYDRGCFQRYCEMQGTFASEDGYKEIADRIKIARLCAR